MEFALVVIALMTIMLGIIDFSRALYTYHFVDHAAKSATRWAAVNGYACAQDMSCPYGPGGLPLTTDITSVSTYISDCGVSGVGSGVTCGATATDIKNYIKNLVPDGINASEVVAGSSVSWPVQSGTGVYDPSPAICSGAVSGFATGAIPNYPGCTVEVTVSYPFQFLYPLVHTGTITLSSTSEMVISH